MGMKPFHFRMSALVLSLCMALTLAPAALAAEEAPQRGVLTYRQAIQPQYEDASRFSEGLAAVKQNGKWGYIDTDGKTVIPFDYDYAFSFNEGVAVVGKLGPHTYTSWEGAQTEEMCFLGFVDHSGAYTPFQTMDYMLDTPALTAFCTYPSFLESDQDYFFHNGLVRLPSDMGDGFYTATGQPFSSELIPTGPMNEGLAPGFPEAIMGAGYMNAQGKTVLFWGDESWENFGPEIETEWGTTQSYRYISRTGSFNQGLAPVWQCTYDASADMETYHLGFINTSGTWVIQPQYTNFFYTGKDSIYEIFGETGLAPVQKDGKYGAIDKTGSAVIPFLYDELWPSNEGLMPFLQNGKCGYLNARDGSVVLPAQFEKVSGFNHGLAVAYDGTKAFLIDRKGQAVPGADKLSPDSYFYESADGAKTVYSPGEYTVVAENGKYGFGHIEYLPTLPEKADMSGWAYAEVSAAIQEELVPTSLQSLYLNNITRAEFCSLVTQAIAQVKGQDIQDVVKAQTGKDLYTWIGEYPMSDTSDSDVIAAYALGIVSGRGNGMFDPYVTITRQEAAAFLMRSAKVLGMDTSKVEAAPFTDSDAVGVWFTDAVNFVYQINVMGGSGDGFSPLGTYTREQSYVTIYRLFQAITTMA